MKKSVAGIILGLLKFIWSTFVRFYPTFFVSFFILGALASAMHDYGQFGKKESMDAVLWLIGFTFVLATLLLSSNTNAFSVKQQKVMSRIGCLFVIARVFMIFGLGMATYGYGHATELLGKGLKYSGIFIYACAVYSLCYGIAEMGIQALKRLFSTSQEKLA